MKTVSLSSQRDEGDFLLVGELAWPLVALRAIVGNLNPRWSWTYRIWSATLLWIDARDRTLVRVPVEHSCPISEALWSRGVGCYHPFGTWAQDWSSPEDSIYDEEDAAAANAALARIEAGEGTVSMAEVRAKMDLCPACRRIGAHRAAGWRTSHPGEGPCLNHESAAARLAAEPSSVCCCGRDGCDGTGPWPSDHLTT